MPGFTDRIKASAMVLTGPSLYYQTVGAVSKSPGLAADIIARIYVKYRREVNAAEYRINDMDQIELLCAVKNISSATIDEKVHIGEIRYSLLPDGSTIQIPARTYGKIGPHSNGQMIGATLTKSSVFKQKHVQVSLNLGPDAGEDPEVFEPLFVNI